METQRLELKELEPGNAGFILDIVNTDEWIKYIGDRNIENTEDALAYIQQITDDPNITYLVIYVKYQPVPVGIVSIVKREYLEHPDIGFALLPGYTGKGYAAEAATYMIEFLAQSKRYPAIHAITLKENQRSIQLLEKLGLQFDREIAIENEQLLVYSMLLQ